MSFTPHSLGWIPSRPHSSMISSEELSLTSPAITCSLLRRFLVFLLAVTSLCCDDWSFKSAFASGL